MGSTQVIGPAFMGLNEVLVVTDVVTREEQGVLRSWAAAQRRADRLLQNPVDATSRSTPFFAAADRRRSLLTRSGADGPAGASLVWVPEQLGPEELPEEFWTIRVRVVRILGIEDLPDDPYKGSFLTSVGPGGDVHTHKDARLPIADDPMPLLRCNILVQRPVGGGMPVIAGKHIDVPDRGMWALHATELMHGATPVTGDVDRITLSFGFVVDPAPVWERPLRHAPDIDPAVLVGVRGTLRDAGMGPERAVVHDALLDWKSFTVREIAEDLGLEPSAVWAEAHRLLRLGVLRSAAPETVPGAQRYAL
jgi:hypothetical protein